MNASMERLGSFFDRAPIYPPALMMWFNWFRTDFVLSQQALHVEVCRCGKAALWCRGQD